MVYNLGTQLSQLDDCIPLLLTKCCNPNPVSIFQFYETTKEIYAYFVVLVFVVRFELQQRVQAFYIR